MRGTGLGYALYSEIIKQGKKMRRVESDWTGIPAIDFTKIRAKVLREIGMLYKWMKQVLWTLLKIN
jgi:hypothetical protein